MTHTTANNQKHIFAHIKYCGHLNAVYKLFIYTSYVENPRVGGSIPPLGTT